MLAFEPLEPEYTAGQRLQSISIHVRDHKLRELTVTDPTKLGAWRSACRMDATGMTRKLQVVRRACTSSDRKCLLATSTGAAPPLWSGTMVRCST
jgi:hypothetical protein